MSDFKTEILHIFNIFFRFSNQTVFFLDFSKDLQRFRDGLHFFGTTLEMLKQKLMTATLLPKYAFATKIMGSFNNCRNRTLGLTNNVKCDFLIFFFQFYLAQN